MSFDWGDIVATYASQPWWVWLAGWVIAWLGLRWLTGAMRSYRKRPILTDRAFRHCGVRVDNSAGTITLPRGGSFSVQRVQNLRWDDYQRSGSYHAVTGVDDLQWPVHSVAFSTSAGPGAFVSRLWMAIEKAGGPGFAVTATDRMEVVEKDPSDSIMAAVATRVRPLGWRRSHSRPE